MNMNMYFLGLVAPTDINQVVLKWKMWMKENFKCEVALRSPAHVTLIPPFWMKPELEKELINTTDIFSANENSFLIQLKDFSFFKPKTIFINVAKNDALETFKQHVETYLVSTEKFPLKKEERSFHPHVTIATRDLYKQAFYEAWDYLKVKNYQAEWLAEGISLLRHNKKNWDVIHTSQFKSFY